MVILRSKTAPRNEWQLGVVSGVTVAEDGLVRRVLVDVISRDAKRRTTEKATHDLVLLHRPIPPLGEGCVLAEQGSVSSLNLAPRQGHRGL